MRATYTVLPAYYTLGHGYVDHVLEILAEREKGKGQVIRFPARHRPVPVAVVEDSSTSGCF